MTSSPGATFTNKGALNSSPYTQEFLLYGNLVNAAGAVFNMNGAGGYGGNLYVGGAGTAIFKPGHGHKSAPLGWLPNAVRRLDCTPSAVSPSGCGPQSPTGEVILLGQGGGQFLGAVPVSAVRGVAQAVLRTTALLPASDNVVAVYLGDENYVSSTSSSLNDDSSPPVQEFDLGRLVT